MSKTIAVFGAGQGLGLSVARRFGREGYRAALVGRTESRLEALATTLRAADIESDIFVADLSKPELASGTVAAIENRFGHIDVLEYAPIFPSPFASARDLGAEKMGMLTNLLLSTPVELVQAVLPGMLARGDGAILMGAGALAVSPLPNMSGAPVPMAALRNYISSLHGELAGTNVHAAMLIVAAMIKGSRLEEIFAEEHGGMAGEVPTVEPDALAEQYWQMVAVRSGFEVVVPTPG
ncbi:SDR family NAD(P)-dependent oxidoreductase [Sphingopyxis sp.]|jgi:short-subunit dehydrogenase|uniref:SDR family NAD(P)-dependent oxidoreductase n=1 Tax=Sphingopyxis sp. TaxID=1908224 RepID=UPI003F72F87B